MARKRRPAKIERSARRSVYRRDDYTCRECGWTPPIVGIEEKIAYRAGLYFLTLDHIIPRSRGGTNVQSNLRTLCMICNVAKGCAEELDPRRRERILTRSRQKAIKRRAGDDQHRLLPRFQAA